MIKQFVAFLAIVLLSNLTFASSVISPNQTYSDYSTQNSGKTGIIEMPNARVMEDWQMRANYNYNNPFIYYGVAISPFPRLEMNFRMTQIQGLVGTGDWSGYGDYKDKAIDLKFLLAKEDEIWPAIAIGVDDITGTALFASKYIVLSKRLGFLDVSGGYAIGRMGGSDISEFYNMRDGQDAAMQFLASTQLNGNFFAGLEAHITPDITLKAEYSPIDYMKDQVNPFKKGLVEEPALDFNFGVAYNLTDKINFSANFERGNSVSLGLHMRFPFDKEGLYPLQPDPRWDAPETLKETFKTKNDEELKNGIADEVAAEKLANVDAAINGKNVWVGIENPRYNSDAKALGRAADTIDEIAPEKIDTLYLALKHRNVEHTVIKVDREELKILKNDPSAISDADMKRNIEIYNNPKDAYKEFSDGKEIAKTESIGTEHLKFIHRPHLQSFFNAKDNPFVYRFTWLAGYQYFPWDGAMIQHRMRVPLFTTMDQIADKTLEPEATATRTDVLKYQQYNNLQMNDFSFDQIINLPFESLGRVSIGYFEPAFAGYGLEWYKPIFNGRFGVGLEYQKVNKREVDDFFAIKDQSFDAKFINFYAEIFPEFGISTSLKYGQFLAGDKGFKWTITRQYKGFTVGAYIAKTDTSIFTSQENKDYVDKGIFFSIPISVVKSQDSQGYLNYGLSAWTRDVAQSAVQPSSLVGTKINNAYRFQSTIEDFKY